MNKLRIYENLHIPLWLLKDTCWAMEFKTLGTIMIFPTLFLAIKIIFKTLSDRFEMLPNLAIACWITANSIWMTDEFYNLGTKKFCWLFFILGMVTIIYWLVLFLPSLYKEHRNSNEQ